MSHADPPPVAARLTPAGSGAIATIALRGAGSRALLSQFFTPLAARGWTSATPGRLLLGHWRRRDGSTEELLLACLGDDAWEIHCHGGVAAVESLLADLRSRGADIVPWDDWLEHDVPDALRREALVELARASTPTTAAILLDQYRGVLRSALESVRRCLVEGETSQATRQVQELLDRWPLGAHLTHPWRVAIVGPPNAGKSSLLNRILGYDRAIVHDEPGTTRDVVSAPAALDGWPIELSDTAGLRPSDDSVEREGIERARSEAKRAELCVYVEGFRQAEFGFRKADFGQRISAGGFRVSEEEPSGDESSAGIDVRSSECLLVLNKWDLRSPDEEPPQGWFAVSALTGEGIDELLGGIVRRLVPRPPRPGTPLPFRDRHWRHLVACQQAIATGDVSRASRELDELLTPGLAW